jgi:stearoyl-CoA desaturase (delta-9 desaturase)
MQEPAFGHPAVSRKSALEQALTLIVVFVPLVATVFAIVKLWQRDVVATDLWLMLGLYLVSGFGITVGFHRFATHRSFRTSKVVEGILLICGSMAIEGSVLQWTADHWKHHKHADQEGDPHSPVEGLFHAHLGWFFKSNRGVPEQDARHLVRDPVARFVSQSFVLWAGLGLALPYLFDGWRGVLWGGLVRVFITHHLTWSVNSVCHQFGRRTFDTADQSGNQWVVGLFGLGEGWHNNHHAFPESAFHGMRWYEVDLSGYLIRALERARLIHGVRRVSLERMERKRIA